MNTLLFALGAVLLCGVAIPVVTLLVQVLAGWRGAPQATAAAAKPPLYGVLMPAHNEAGTLAPSIAAVLRQLPPWGRLLVVADNCTDATADEARAAGAEVIERRDPLLRGKGHALAFGIAHWRADPPDVVVVLDADCIPAPGALDLLATAAAQTDRPAQALYLMLARPGSSWRVRMAAFAWALRNHLRPLGMHKLGFPCQLMGSGMALPWSCVDRAALASGHLTEDMELGVALAGAGRAPRFCPAARVDSWFPQAQAALASQRTRWEHGHLAMILSGVPRLLWRAVRQRDAQALALALDLCVPPLALLALLVLGACGLIAWTAGAGAVGPAWLAVAVAVGCAFVLAIGLAWWRVGRQWLSGAELLLAPVHVLAKLPGYAGFLLRRQKEWVRTGRGP